MVSVFELLAKVSLGLVLEHDDSRPFSFLVRFNAYFSLGTALLISAYNSSPGFDTFMLLLPVQGPVGAVSSLLSTLLAHTTVLDDLSPRSFVRLKPLHDLY
jgi:hypothetical protein